MYIHIGAVLLSGHPLKLYYSFVFQASEEPTEPPDVKIALPTQVIKIRERITAKAFLFINFSLLLLPPHSQIVHRFLKNLTQIPKFNH